ncbi:unnamed protein product [Haemonchus placei]|uniref:CBS domain-containing protein n=1 Tax=Haemonchus placei TaxID=6290 RepID=A0A0N4X3M8_HAEPC|nr:unnamed protein product [Haemonchus placei]
MAKKMKSTENINGGLTTPLSKAVNVETSKKAGTGQILPWVEFPNFAQISASIIEQAQTDALVEGRQDLGKLSIKTYKELLQKEGKLMELVYINANNSLLEAARLLAQHHIHRLPVLDPESGTPLFIITHKRLLKVVDMYSRFDAMGIALEESADSLDVSVEQALKFKNSGKNDNDRAVSVRDTDMYLMESYYYSRRAECPSFTCSQRNRRCRGNHFAFRRDQSYGCQARIYDIDSKTVPLFSKIQPPEGYERHN